MLDAHQVNIFLVAAETLNFTHAAQRLNMTQPSVSQHIQSLEQHFEESLFLREGRSLQLTDAGKTLIPLARDMVKQSVLIEETMSSLDGEVYGELTVACSTTPGKYILPLLLAEFHRRYPRVNMRCKVYPQQQAVEELCSGRVCFAMASFARDVCQAAEFIKFICDPVVLIVPTDHPWATRKMIAPEELYDEKIIMREEESGTYKAVQEGLFSRGVHLDDLDIFLTLGNSEAIAIAVQEHLGVGFVSSPVAKVIGGKKVAEVGIIGVEVCRDIYIGRHARVPISKAHIAFWDFVNDLDQVFLRRLSGKTRMILPDTQLK